MKTGKKIATKENVDVYEHPDNEEFLIIVPKGSKEGITALKESFLSRPNTSLAKADGEPIELSRLHNTLMFEKPDSPSRNKMENKSLREGLEIKSLKYTKPELRERLKRQIMAGDKGGKPGQWSARKAQLLAQAYKKAGGGYRGGLGKNQRSLRKWTREKWTTSDGKPANRPGGMRRYLPAKAWSRLTPAERAATNRKKIQGSRRGNQFVRNTKKARTVGKNVRNSRSS